MSAGNTPLLQTPPSDVKYKVSFDENLHQALAPPSSIVICCESLDRDETLFSGGIISQFDDIEVSKHRAILKNGNCNVKQTNLNGYRLRYFQDIFNTLIDLKWRWTLLAFAFSFISTWLIFTIFWWIIGHAHDDFDANNTKGDWTPCFTNIKDLRSIFLLSMETQVILGYSIRMPTDECPEALFLEIVQILFSIIHTTFMLGFIFTKMTGGKQRAQTLCFSKYAIICQENGDLQLMFRVGDLRKSHINQAKLRAQLIRQHVTREGEVCDLQSTELKMQADNCGPDLFLIWPITVMHKIDENSPFYNMSASKLWYDRFEIIVALEGVVESTGQIIQARTSYLNNEIMWGWKFEPIMKECDKRKRYVVDHSRFDEIVKIDAMPMCSANKYRDFVRAVGAIAPISSNLEKRRSLPSTSTKNSFMLRK